MPMLDDDFNKRQANLLRDLTSQADPFIKRRLLDLAKRYEKPQTKPLPSPTIDGRNHADQKDRNGVGLEALERGNQQPE
jgi:hypothetical protein